MSVYARTALSGTLTRIPSWPLWQQTKCAMRGSIALIGSKAKPFCRLFEILLHPVSVLEREAKVQLGVNIALISSKAVPLCRLFRVLLHPSSVIKHVAKRTLRLSMALISGKAVLFCGLGIVPWHHSSIEHAAKISLHAGITPFSGNAGPLIFPQHLSFVLGRRLWQHIE